MRSDKTRENHMVVSIEKWGKSAAVRLPKRILEALSWDIGDKVAILQKGNTLVIEPCKPSLNDLLSKITPQNRHLEVFPDSAGNELI
jgi:antitoxin MazE